MIQTTMLHADAEMSAGPPQQALARVEQALATAISSPRNDILYRMLRAMLLRDMDRATEAEAEARQVHSEAIQHRLPLEQGITARIIGQVLLMRGEAGAAHKSLAEAA